LGKQVTGSRFTPAFWQGKLPVMRAFWRERFAGMPETAS